MRLDINVHVYPAGADGLAELTKLLHVLSGKVDKAMSKISEFSDAVNASFNDINKGIDGLAGDIKTLNDKITELQNTPGPLSPEDQALLDAIQATAVSAASRVKALDDLTPPVAPPG